jgi:putative FmdB family regulatory protein
MPIYVFSCPQCKEDKEELRKIGDYSPPLCVCGLQMERIFTPVTALLKGAGWSKGQWSKLNKRSQEQNQKFFRRHPAYREMADRKIQEKRTLEGG